MSDLNSWLLTYGMKSFEFGTLASDFPFSVQVDIDDAAMTLQDERHPVSDGVLMGKDTFGGFTITFALTTIPEFPAVDKPWHGALDTFSAFKSAWRADSLRANKGEYALLTNLDRNRCVFGRPRKCSPTLKSLRTGVAEYMATFDTNGPDFYSATEKVAVIALAPAASRSVISPVTAPVGTAALAATPSDMVNEGDVDAWPVLQFHGPSPTNSVELIGDNGPEWLLSLSRPLKYDDILTVDTRPWRRSATLNGSPANGLLRGSPLEECSIPPGEFYALYRTRDQTGQAFASISWRDGFASL